MSQSVPLGTFFLISICLLCTWTVNRIHSIEFENKVIDCPICSWNLITWHMSIRWWHVLPISLCMDTDKNHIYTEFSTNMLLSYLDRTTFIAKGSRQKNESMLFQTCARFLRQSVSVLRFLSVTFLAWPIKSVHIVQSSKSRPHRTNQKVLITHDISSFISLRWDCFFSCFFHECLV